MTMSLHSLENATGARHRQMRVGRGRSSGKGKTSGRGHKGQYARSGHKHKAGFEGGQMRFARRLPKRGFTDPVRRVLVPVNVGVLERLGTNEVTVAALQAAGLANAVKDGVKILGGGELNGKLHVKAQAFSATARAKIEAAGGTCEVVKLTA